MTEEAPELETAALKRLEWLHAVVTKERPLPSTYRPHDLALFERSTKPIKVRRRILPSLRAMLEAFSARDRDLLVISGYRSHAYQGRVFSRFVEHELERGLLPAQAESVANRYSARPGHSEHQLGTTVDLSVPELDYQLTDKLDTTPAGRWLLENAHRFGFVLSYPRHKEHLTGYVYEPWHFRWIGVEHATCLHLQGYLDPETAVTSSAYLQELERVSRRTREGAERTGGDTPGS